jgi:BMFP domain-containing protein YqiC
VAERVERLDTDLGTTREKLEELEQRLVRLEGQVGGDRTPRR